MAFSLCLRCAALVLPILVCARRLSVSAYRNSAKVDKVQKVASSSAMEMCGESDPLPEDEVVAPTSTAARGQNFSDGARKAYMLPPQRVYICSSRRKDRDRIGFIIDGKVVDRLSAEDVANILPLLWTRFPEPRGYLFVLDCDQNVILAPAYQKPPEFVPASNSNRTKTGDSEYEIKHGDLTPGSYPYGEPEGEANSLAWKSHTSEEALTSGKFRGRARLGGEFVPHCFDDKLPHGWKLNNKAGYSLDRLSRDDYLDYVKQWVDGDEGSYDDDTVVGDPARWRKGTFKVSESTKQTHIETLEKFASYVHTALGVDMAHQDVCSCNLHGSSPSVCLSSLSLRDQSEEMCPSSQAEIQAIVQIISLNWNLNQKPSTLSSIDDLSNSSAWKEWLSRLDAHAPDARNMLLEKAKKTSGGWPAALMKLFRKFCSMSQWWCPDRDDIDRGEIKSVLQRASTGKRAAFVKFATWSNLRTTLARRNCYV
eukprot:TRINITY_DN25987_c0_g2_i1.p1 TRINITY_DN25987_c0_g2~~TRINITY_DN25987_c0_g2_i1.p1  ORF type:complete len:496 (+),score=49.72 TRINITY_DN25987_c0_g2_i1:48-1490(+)